jgi:hypothetical protein
VVEVVRRGRRGAEPPRHFTSSGDADSGCSLDLAADSRRSVLRSAILRLILTRGDRRRTPRAIARASPRDYSQSLGRVRIGSITSNPAEANSGP